MHALSVASVLALATTYVSAKAGLAWSANDGNSVNIQQFHPAGSKVSWYYSYSPDPVANSGIEFVPMLWGTKQEADFQNTIGNTIKSLNVKDVLGPNEPDNGGQSALSVGDGINLWKQFLQPLKGQFGVRLGSPGVSSAPSGKQWLSDFFNQCGSGCTVDFIALHWYGTDAGQFQSYVQDLHNTFNKPIWITEWACQNFVDPNAQCNAGQVSQFMTDTVNFLEGASYVERYSWFGAFRNLNGVNPLNALEDGNGVITGLGHQYIGV